MQHNQELPTMSLTADWQDAVVFSANGAKPVILFEDEQTKVIVAGLEAGSQIPTHPEAQSVYYFLVGDGWMTVDERRFAVKEGMTIVLPHGTARGIEAGTRLAFLAVRHSPE